MLISFIKRCFRIYSTIDMLYRLNMRFRVLLGYTDTVFYFCLYIEEHNTYRTLKLYNRTLQYGTYMYSEAFNPGISTKLYNTNKQLTIYVVHGNIDQLLVTTLYCLVNCEMGGLDGRVIKI